MDLCRSGSNDHAKQLASEHPAQSCSFSDGESRYLLIFFFLFFQFSLYNYFIHSNYCNLSAQGAFET